MDDGMDEHTAKRSRPLAPWIVLVVAIALGGLFFALASANPSSGATADSPLIGRPAPEATGTLSDGTSFDLSRRKGSWVVLNFFDPDCIPCVQEHPELIEFDADQELLGADGAELYSVIVRGSQDEVEAFFDERGGDWPAIYSEFDDFPVAFGVAAVPETWIIDPSGVVQLRMISKVTAEQLNVILQQYREQYS
ncbi:MAG: TlpA family protein disulfide reductase [Actinobacteria bacterium]|nr:TlpA family protein disulfide reductase [Actinomycetota bacterium]